MNITILALGSRGDVQPFVALGRALVARGHRVLVAATADYGPLVQDHGLPFAPVVGRFSDLMDVELIYQALDAAKNPLPLGFARRFVEHVSRLIPGIVADCATACAGADAVLVSSLGLYPGALIAEARGLPLVLASFHPSSSTRAHPDISFPPLPPWLPLRGRYNLFTHSLAHHGLWQLLRGPLNHVRLKLGLPKRSAWELWQQIRSLRPPIMYGYSPLLLPPPPDWDDRTVVTGSWFLDAPPGWHPPDDLVRFLESGPPPVYLSFGSILAGRDPNRVTRLLLAALDRCGQRGLISSAWGDLGGIPLPPHVLRVGSLPHSWLFPRVAAVVTHGGAGTVAAALRAGLPPVVVPFFGDQRLWAQRCHALGVAPPPAPRHMLSVPRLANALGAALENRVLRGRATALGALLVAEQGAEVAATALLNLVEV
jgi:UDP:flavonoid glycosyltransferase YjiC (YdhE family)